MKKAGETSNSTVFEKEGNETERKENGETSVNYYELGTQTEVTDGLVTSRLETGLASERIELKPEEEHEPGSSTMDYERVQVDAVHPFLMNCINSPRKSVGTSTEEDRLSMCYCKQCNSYFNNSLPDKIQHFVNAVHNPDTSCVYCKGPVYYYTLNKKRNVYHKCQNEQAESLSIKNNNNNNKPPECNKPSE